MEKNELASHLHQCFKFIECFNKNGLHNSTSIKCYKEESHFSTFASPEFFVMIGQRKFKNPDHASSLVS